MKYGLFLLLGLGIIFGAYFEAQKKISRPFIVSSVRLGMDMKEIRKIFGRPVAASNSLLTYILEDGSELYISLRDNVASSATLKFHPHIKIQDPEMKKLTLVQMDIHGDDNKQMKWFFAGSPEEGLIYKITSKGIIESLTWIPPFSYDNNRPKHLQALYGIFKPDSRQKCDILPL